jgi:hypothetical protein
MTTVFIYTLTDPFTNLIRYVGKTKNFDQRRKNHLNRFRDTNTHKRNWIASVKRKGKMPIMEIVDEVPESTWHFWEKYWISQFKSWGFDLVNYTEGGDGCTTANKTSFKGENAKPVVGVNKEGLITYEFSSATAAANYFGVHRSSVSGSANRSVRNKTVKETAWYYKSEFDQLSKEQLLNDLTLRFRRASFISNTRFKKGQFGIRSKPVKVINLITNEICKYASGTAAANAIGVNQASVSWAIVNNRPLKKKQFKITYL